MRVLAVLIGWPGLPGDVGTDQFGPLLFNVALLAALILLLFAGITLAGYAHSARSRKVEFPSDVYRGYAGTFGWLLLSIPAGLVAIWTTFALSKELLGEVQGFRWEFSLEIGCLTAVLCALCSYLLIAWNWPIPLTPDKLRYRPRMWIK
jgi:hypothetical protein